jgi:hypothetical protein
MKNSHNELLSLERGKGCIRRKCLRGMLRPKPKKGSKTWIEKGKGFWQSFFVLFLDDGMRPQDLFLYEKRWLFDLGMG